MLGDADEIAPLRKLESDLKEARTYLDGKVEELIEYEDHPLLDPCEHLLKSIETVTHETRRVAWFMRKAQDIRNSDKGRRIGFSHLPDSNEAST